VIIGLKTELYNWSGHTKMEMQQMMERLLAKMDVNQSEMKANREAG
jgi:hypothetical protein